MTMTGASFWCLCPMASGLTTEPTKMGAILSMLLGMTEKVLSNVPIGNHNVIC